MTWTKLGSEFADECATVDLSDAAFRTHVEAIAFIYDVTAEDCRFPKRAVRRFATSEKATAAISELCAHGWWADRETHFEVLHHADVIVDSLHAQSAKKDRDRAAKQRQRAKEDKPPKSSDVSADVSADPRQTDRQTDKHLGPESIQTCQHGIRNGQMKEPWPVEKGQLLCADCTRERKTA